MHTPTDHPVHTSRLPIPSPPPSISLLNIVPDSLSPHSGDTSALAGHTSTDIPPVTLTQLLNAISSLSSTIAIAVTTLFSVIQLFPYICPIYLLLMSAKGKHLLLRGRIKLMGTIMLRLKQVLLQSLFPDHSLAQHVTKSTLMKKCLAKDQLQPSSSKNSMQNETSMNEIIVDEDLPRIAA
ncbi:hypothetical protein L2E82_48546 [Cichorium intybus]|uniref:Uncharacterized protein n=1 Tax=Cichorium intybus TaxID=13427 RepID=A0ACB8YYA2_CICIN|nr:hypothetical protein L2E82_48546 [Cichorium intybus]